MSLFSKTPKEVSALTLKGLQGWIETCVTRLGIPIESSEPYEPAYGEAVITLGGDHEHTRICYAKGKYWLSGFNPFMGYDFFIEGKGELEVEIQRCRDESFTVDY